MIAFFLSMPHVASWNSEWSGEGKIYARLRRDNQVPKEYINQSFEYRWDDGWEASVEVKKVDSKEAANIRKKSAGFYGYDWMIDSIIDHGKIITPEDFVDNEGNDNQKFNLAIYRTTGCHAVDNYTAILHEHFSLNNLNDLIDKNLLDPNIELYSGGPTIDDLIRFMTKHRDILYILIASVKNGTFYFEKFYENPFRDAHSTVETNQELNTLLKDTTKEISTLGYEVYVF